jgi:enoyl-CoA hydratase
MTEPSTDDVVLYELQDSIATITLNRPRYHNAQNSALLYELDRMFCRFAQDDNARVAIVTGRGANFSAGHDLGPESDRDRSFPRISMWWDHVSKVGAENRLAREAEVYLGLCRRWRDIPKPTIAMVRGACIAGGLMLAWSCDLIFAAKTAYFADPVVAMGLPGHEFFAHPWIMGARQAKEFLYLGERVDADRALDLRMVNRVVRDEQLDEVTADVARRISLMPRLGLTLTKLAINQAEDAMGLRTGMDAAFALHQLGHSHNVETTGSSIRGRTSVEIKAVVNGRYWRERGD